MPSLLDAVSDEIASLPKAIQGSPEAVLCLLLAEKTADTTPRDAATLSKELRAALAALREAVNAAGKRGDKVDELRARRAARKPSNPGGAAVNGE